MIAFALWYKEGLSIGFYIALGFLFASLFITLQSRHKLKEVHWLMEEEQYIWNLANAKDIDAIVEEEAKVIKFANDSLEKRRKKFGVS